MVKEWWCFQGGNSGWLVHWDWEREIRCCWAYGATCDQSHPNPTSSFVAVTFTHHILLRLYYTLLFDLKINNLITYPGTQITIRIKSDFALNFIYLLHHKYY